MNKSAETAQTNRRFLATETRFHGKYEKSLANTLFQAFRPALFRTLLFLMLGVLGRFALLGNANFIGYWVDSFCTGPGPCRPIPVLFQNLSSAHFLMLLGVSTSVGFILTLIFRSGLSRISAEAVSRIYDETTLRTSRLSMSFFDQNPAGRVMTRFASDYNNIFRIFGGPLAEFLGLIFDLLVMTVLIAVASPWFLPLWFMQALIAFGVYRLNLTALRRERREMALKRSPGIAHFAESAQGANTIRAYGKEKTFETRFSQLNDAYLSQRLTGMTVFIRFAFSMGVVTTVMFLVTGLLSTWLVSTGRLSIGSVGVAFAYLGLSSNILQSFFEWLGQFEEAMTGLERMNEYLRLPLEPGLILPATARFSTGHPVLTQILGNPENQKIQSTAGPLGVSVEIQDLWMRYREDLPAILQGINLTIKPGEKLAIIGKTGSGKTSLVQALFRLYPIARGNIFIAGKEARTELKEENHLDLKDYRSLLAYITQEPTLFLGTLRENLVPPGKSLGDDHEEQLVEALRRVQFLNLEASYEEYQKWLDHSIEERGRNLSSGERQLICMARCLLQNTPVVVLDEATSSVDPRSEEILNRATEKFFVGKTQILIAHRLSSIRSCDRVLWLQNGKIHRLGPPSEVLPEFEGAELLT